MSAASDYPNRVVNPRDETIADLRQQLAAAIAERERDAKDAARYRWLRGHFRFANDSLRELWFDPSLEPNDSGVPTDLDQEIDAAIDAATATADAAQGDGL